MERKSKKRDSVEEIIKQSYDHPSAADVYEKLKERYPNLSPATVYRNIKKLENVGKIRSCGVINGIERFDGRTEPHTHAVCAVCGKIIDVNGINSYSETPEINGFDVAYTELKLVGVCSECKTKCK